MTDEAAMTTASSSTSRPRLCVLMTTFNGERHIGEQLDSIARQTIVPDEIVIGDDRIGRAGAGRDADEERPTGRRTADATAGLRVDRAALGEGLAGRDRAELLATGIHELHRAAGTYRRCSCYG